MNFYPSELITPPLALVALLGCPELHPEIGEFLRSQHKPPINSLGVADPWAAARLFGERKTTLTAPADHTGILKANWFAKHRQKRPAVAVLFLDREAVVGSPSDWAVACSAMEAVKSAAKARGARLVVVVVGTGAELPEERSGAISRISSVDKKCVVLLDPGEGEAGLRRLGRVLYEAAGQSYLDAARRRLSLHAERRIQTPELSARVAFKAAALAEFRADWATAVKTFQNAYAEVSRVGLGPPLPLQRAFEVAAVAEHIHVKVVTLLLHQQRLAEALAQFRAHLGLFRRPPFALPPAAAAAHWGWVSRQHTVMAELLDTRVDPALLPPQRDAQPAHFFLCAAQAAIQRQRWAARAGDARGGRAPFPPVQPLVPGPYIGQVAVLDPPRRLTDEEFVQHLEVQEAGLDHASLALEALALAQEHCSRAAGGKGSRQAYYIGLLIAREHMAKGDAATAHRLLLLVAGIYRREQWRLPLAAALLELLECATRLDLAQEKILHSLELSTLEGSLPLPQRQELALSALSSLADGKAFGEDGHQLVVKPVNHPLLSCFLVSAGFVEQSAQNGRLKFGVALLSFLPVDVPVRRVEASFVSGGADTSTVQLEGGGAALCAAEWTYWTGEISSAAGTTMAAQDVVLHLSSNASVHWHLPSVPGSQLLGGCNAEADAELLRHASPLFVPGLHEAKLPSIFQPVELRVDGESFALVGEEVAVHLSIAAPSAVENATIRVRAGFLEGGPHPSLTLTDLQGERHDGREVGPDTVDGVPTPAACMLGPLLLGDLAPGQHLSLDLGVTVPRRGQLLLLVTVGHDGSQGDAGAGGASSTLEVAVEEPFDVTTQLMTLPMTSSLILPQPSSEAHSLPEAAADSAQEALPAGETCLLRASLRVRAPTEVEVAHISAQSQEGIEFIDASAAGVTPACPASLAKSDIFACVLRLRCTSSSQHASLGHLLVSWKRRRKAGAAGKSVETVLTLPGARFEASVLSVRVEMPGAAVAGQALPLRLALRNSTPLPQRFNVAVGDASGFVLAGGRSETGCVLPNSSGEHLLTLVSYAAGVLALPQIRVTALRYNAVVEPLAGHKLLVSPAPVELPDPRR